MATDDDDGERHIEMTWHCATCKHQNLGRFKQCQSCGKPKEAEDYEMPADTTSAATVTDAALLRMATAGPDWRCAYCGTDQRASDGSCGQCGASAVTTEPLEPLVASLATPPRPWRWVPWAIVGALVLVFTAIPIAMWNARRPRTYEGTVVKVTWTQEIDVDRYADREHEGFKETIPEGSTDIASLGQKLHHQQQILDHMDTESYTEQVPDGYTTETYTDSTSCGQDCTSSPQSCHEECTSKKNGFASCHQVCSGGGTTCTPKLCNETRTRQIPKTRSELRTRQVPKYRYEPVYAESFHYKVWDWQHDRTVRATGSDATTMHWPDNGARDSGLPDGEREREDRHGTYAVTLHFHDQTIYFTVKTPAELVPFTPNSKHEVRRTAAGLFVDKAPVEPAVVAP